MPNIHHSRRAVFSGASFSGGGGGTPLVYPLDTLLSQGASLVAAFSTRRLLTSYNSSALRLRSGGTGSVETAIGFTAGGDLDTTAVAAAIAQGGGTVGFWRWWYDQSGNARHAGQATAANQPQYNAGTHGKGAALGNGNTTKMDTASFSRTQPHTVFAIYNRTAGAGSSALIGPISGGGISNTIYAANPTWTAYFGNFFEPAAVYPTDGVWQSLTAVINGASSSMRVNAGTLSTGNAGTASADGIRLLGRPDGAVGWNGLASEFVIFAGDPTGLAGWADFHSAALTYFA